jgi:hypothetical protein
LNIIIPRFLKETNCSCVLFLSKQFIIAKALPWTWQLILSNCSFENCWDVSMSCIIALNPKQNSFTKLHWWFYLSPCRFFIKNDLKGKVFLASFIFHRFFPCTSHSFQAQTFFRVLISSVSCFLCVLCCVLCSASKPLIMMRKWLCVGCGGGRKVEK